MYGNYPTGADGAAASGFGIVFLLCWGVLILIGLALFALNIWMLIDAIGRQEYEYPGSTGNSKNLWVILMAVGIVLSFGWLVALFYYFMVFKKMKRGSVAPQWAQPGAPQPPQQYAPPQAPVYAPPAPPAYQPPPAQPEAYMPPPAPPAPSPPAPEPPAEPPAAPGAEQ
jgi:hypothetical protein